MKKTINVAIGGCGFTLEEDAYKLMNDYLDGFKGALDESSVNDNVMDELEDRIADLLKQRMGGCEVATAVMVQEIIDQVGYPEGYSPKSKETEYVNAPKRSHFTSLTNSIKSLKSACVSLGKPTIIVVRNTLCSNVLRIKLIVCLISSIVPLRFISCNIRSLPY